MRVTEIFTRVGRRRTPLLLLAALLLAAATMLPLWGMTLVSTQYPEGLRMVVYPSGIVGDLGEINALNHYIGMTPISDDFFVELRFLRPALLAMAAVLLVAALARRARWIAVMPLAAMAVLGAGGLGIMRYRLWQFGHQLDPQAAITIDPFTPPMIGLNQIAQFATYSYFSWGVFLPLTAGVLVALVVLADRRHARPAVRRRMLAVA
jgi:copper chaperone NosL